MFRKSNESESAADSDSFTNESLSGADSDSLKLAGHSDPNITMKIYTHTNVDTKKAAIEAMWNAYMKRDRKAS